MCHYAPSRYFVHLSVSICLGGAGIWTEQPPVWFFSPPPPTQHACLYLSSNCTSPRGIQKLGQTTPLDQGPGTLGGTRSQWALAQTLVPRWAGYRFCWAGSGQWWRRSAQPKARAAQSKEKSQDRVPDRKQGGRSQVRTLLGTDPEWDGWGLRWWPSATSPLCELVGLCVPGALPGAGPRRG